MNASAPFFCADKTAIRAHHSGIETMKQPLKTSPQVPRSWHGEIQKRYTSNAVKPEMAGVRRNRNADVSASSNVPVETIAHSAD